MYLSKIGSVKVGHLLFKGNPSCLSARIMYVGNDSVGLVFYSFKPLLMLGLGVQWAVLLVIQGRLLIIE